MVTDNGGWWMDTFSRLTTILPTAALALVTLMGIETQRSASYDVLIRGGRILDGSGNPWFQADVGVEDNRIVAIGNLASSSATTVLNATGLYVAPGFIDVHSHASEGLTDPQRSDALGLLHQGVTTVVLNPDGGGPVDLGQQRIALLADGIGVNAALMVPHGSVRRAVLGMEDRRPTDAELGRMRDLVRRGMEQGAFGLSSGLFYAPGSYSETEEVIELTRVAAAFDGVYASHIRDESDYTVGVIAAVDEVIQIARAARLPGVVTHVKALGPHVWGFSAGIVRRIELAREAGIEVYVDQYPYVASGTSIVSSLVPRWAQAGRRDALQQRMDDTSTMARIREAMVSNLDRRGGADRILIGRFLEETALEGMTLQEIADARGIDPIDAAIELIRAGNASVISFNMDERDLHFLMTQPWTMTSSDGGLPRWEVGVPHPRSYGTFPRKIRRYVVEQRVVPLAFAIRSMTSLPATVFRIADRGTMRVGAFADIAIFDLTRLTDRATFTNPHQLSEGITHVLVNGTLAIHNDVSTGERSGSILKR